MSSNTNKPEDYIDCPKCHRKHKKNSFLWVPHGNLFKVHCQWCGDFDLDLKDAVGEGNKLDIPNLGLDKARDRNFLLGELDYFSKENGDQALITLLKRWLNSRLGINPEPWIVQRRKRKTNT